MRPQRDLLRRAAVLHDIGKMALPEGVLGHSHVLDPAARRVMERHTVLGASILAHARAPWMQLAATIALNHHERWDGSGYPAGLAGEDIPLAARLVAVADVYDALRSDRPYKDPLDHDEALARLLDGDGRIAPGAVRPAGAGRAARSRGRDRRHPALTPAAEPASGSAGARRLVDHAGHLRLGHRAAEQVALRGVAALGQQFAQLRLGLHALGDRRRCRGCGRARSPRARSPAHRRRAAGPSRRTGRS